MFGARTPENGAVDNHQQDTNRPADGKAPQRLEDEDDREEDMPANRDAEGISEGNGALDDPRLDEASGAAARAGSWAAGRRAAAGNVVVERKLRAGTVQGPAREGLSPRRRGLP